MKGRPRKRAGRPVFTCAAFNFMNRLILIFFVLLSPVAAQTPDQLILSPSEITLEVGQSTQIEMKVLDRDWIRFTPKLFAWLPSANEPLASARNCLLKGGFVTALRPGKCWVSAAIFDLPHSGLAPKAPTVITVVLPAQPHVGCPWSAGDGCP